MLTTSELKRLLGATPRQWAAWKMAGLPSRRDGRRTAFDPAEVSEWFLDRGEPQLALKVYPGEVAQTRGDAARSLEVSTRTIAEWLNTPGFPGRAGSPGKQDGWFPIDAIRQWRDQSANPNVGAEKSPWRDVYWEAKAKQEVLDLEERMGRLVDAEEVQRFLLRVVNSAKAVLDPMPDKVLASLPAGTKRKTKISIRKKVERDLHQAYEALAELITGDRDEHDEES